MPEQAWGVAGVVAIKNRNACAFLCVAALGKRSDSYLG